MITDESALTKQLEAVLFTATKPMSVEALGALFPEETRPTVSMIKSALTQLQQDYADRGITLKEVASGFRFQTHLQYSQLAMRLLEEKPQRYSRALLETLALIAYRQPITRAEIEDVRGVAVATGIMKTLTERGWVRIVGHREVPGKPGLYATTREFLDYFNLKSLDEMPTLSEIKEWDARIEQALNLPTELPIKIEATEDEFESA